MTNAYVILLSYELGSRKEVEDYLDTLDEIDHWFACLPNCIFCVSSLTAPVLADKLKGYFGKKMFLVMECHPNRQGLLPAKAWDLMRMPENFSKEKTH